MQVELIAINEWVTSLSKGEIFRHQASHQIRCIINPGNRNENNKDSLNIITSEWLDMKLSQLENEEITRIEILRDIETVYHGITERNYSIVSIMAHDLNSAALKKYLRSASKI